MSLRGSSPSDARAAYPHAQRRVVNRTQILGAPYLPCAQLARNAQTEGDTDGMIQERFGRPTFEAQLRAGRAPHRISLKNKEPSAKITCPGDELLHTELAAFWWLLTSFPNLLLHFFLQSKSATSVFVKQTQPLTQTVDLPSLDFFDDRVPMWHVGSKWNHADLRASTFPCASRRPYTRLDMCST